MITIQQDGYFTGNKAGGYKVKGNLPPELLKALKDLLESLESDEELADRLVVEHVSPEDALKFIEKFEWWEADTEYKKGDRRKFFDGQGMTRLYECDQAHTSQAGWEPQNTPALWKGLSGRLEEIEDWKQPESNNPYKKGDKVKHKDKTWESTIDGNVWEPGTHGWEVESDY